MMDPVKAWRAEHAYFNRLLDLLHREVDVFPTGGQPNYELMLDIISYLREYSDHYHHPREDIAFARLERHRPQLAATLARLRQEHRVIANTGETLERLLTAIIEGSIVARTEVEAAAATYLVYYGKHIAREESDVLPHASRALTPDDWQAVRDAIPAAADPLFGETPVQRYRELRRRMS